ncbi:hypothetical protein B6U67_02265 [Methanosarcinales archaeon ex4484_138]|nr:MAG: hypothetical protein B6U67_02265 [Methanosarcinales archaeon ex4484_138]
MIEFLDALIRKVLLFIKELLPSDMTEFLFEETDRLIKDLPIEITEFETDRLIKDLPIEITEFIKEKTYQGLMTNYGRSLSGYNILDKELQNY